MINEVFDEQKFRLGKLCNRGHNWNGTGQSLRRRCNNKCVECEKEYTLENREKLQSYLKNYYRENADILRERSKQWHEENKDYARQRNNEYRKQHKEQDAARSRKYRLNNSEKVKERAKLRYRNRPEVRRIIAGRYRLKNLSKFRLYSHNRRARKAANGIEKYTFDQVQEKFAIFNDACAYCGASEDLTMDHFASISKGGKDSINNIIPACLACNSSKCNHDAFTWYSRQSFFDDDRWRLICSQVELDK